MSGVGGYPGRDGVPVQGGTSVQRGFVHTGVVTWAQVGVWHTCGCTGTAVFGAGYWQYWGHGCCREGVSVPGDGGPHRHSLPASAPPGV